MTEYQLPPPSRAVCVMVSEVGSTHMTPKGDYYSAKDVLQAYAAGREALDKEVSALRELAAGRCTAPTVIAEIGSLSLWSKPAFDEKIADAEKRGREAMRQDALRLFEPLFEQDYSEGVRELKEIK